MTEQIKSLSLPVLIISQILSHSHDLQIEVLGTGNPFSPR